MVRNYKGCTGLKTGSTSLALYNLSASATRDNMNLIAVVMKAPTSKDRFNIASKLLDYGFSNFEYKSLAKQNDIIKSVKVNKGITPYINAIVSNNCGALIKKGNDVNIEQNISIENALLAPISAEQIVGKITYTLNGDIISECNLIASETVDKISFLSLYKVISFSWLNLLRN